MMRLLAWLVAMVAAETIYVQVGFSHSHFGCAEAELASLEHVLIPRALWCDEHHCWQRGRVDFRVHSIVCENSTSCDIELYCDASIRPILEATGMTVVGMALIFAMICCCAPSAGVREDDDKDHQL